VTDLQRQLESILTSKVTNHALAWQEGEACDDLHISFEYWKERLTWLHTGDSWINEDG
jgi:hypothetical protein